MKKAVAPRAFDVVRKIGLALPDVEAATNWAGAPVLRARGCFMAGLASHESAEPGSLVIDLGEWRRNLVLPRALIDAAALGAQFEDHTLKIRFAAPERVTAQRRR